MGYLVSSVENKVLNDKYLSKIELSTVDRHVKDDEQKVFVCHYPDVYNNEKITSNKRLFI